MATSTNEELLEKIIVGEQTVLRKGNPVGGIPFTNPNHDRRALTVLHMPTGKFYTKIIGADDYKYSQQSMSKPSAAMFAIISDGANIGLTPFSEQIDNVYSGMKYNLLNVYPGTTRPYNYSDNIGAIKVWQLIYNAQKTKVDPFPRFLIWFQNMIGRAVEVDMDMANGELGAGGANEAILDKLGLAGAEQRENRRWIYFSYCRACAIKVTTLDSARVFAVISNKGRTAGPSVRQIVPENVASFIHTGMGNHGAYDQSRDLLTKYGLRSKTGVEGGIMGHFTRKSGGALLDWVFAGQHSGLNRMGNSGEVIKWIRALREADVDFTDSGDLSGTLSDHSQRGEALHLSLFRTMKPGTVSAIEDALEAALTAKVLPKDSFRNEHTKKLEFFLKRNHNKRNLQKGDLLASGTDMNGQFKHYYLMPTVAHWIAKVAVLDSSEGIVDNWRRQRAK